MSNVRQATNTLIELAEQGVISWESIATACLRYMSEADVADMAHDYDWLNSEDELARFVADIERADDLAELCKILNRAHDELSHDDYQNLDVSNLPTFGGIAPTNPLEIYSWDETHILINDGNWMITKRK